MAKRRSKSPETPQPTPLTLGQIEVMADKAMRIVRLPTGSKRRCAAREEKFGAGVAFNPDLQYQESVLIASEDVAAVFAAVKYLCASARIVLPKGTRFEIRMGRSELAWVSQPKSMAEDRGWKEFVTAVGENLVEHVGGYFLIGRQTA